MTRENIRSANFRIVLPLMILLPLMFVTHATAQSPSAKQPQLSNAQMAELQKAAALNNQVVTLVGQGKQREATVIAEQALKIREAILGPEHADTLTSLNNLAVIYSDQANHAAAEPLYLKAIEISEKVFGPEHRDTALRINNLGFLYYSQANYEAAEPLYKRALKIWEKVLGPEHPDTANSINNLAALYTNQGNYAAAEPLYQRALKIREKALGPEHPLTALTLNNLASLYDSQAKYAAAEPLYQRALKISEKVLGPEHPQTALSLSNLALLYYSQVKYAAAEPLYQRALKIREKVLGPEHPDTAISINCLAELYRSQANYAAAEPLYQRALKIQEKVLGPEHPTTATSLNNLAALYDDQENYTAAEPLYQRALTIQEKVLGPEHPATALSLNNLATLYDDQANYSAAEPFYRRALTISEKVLGPEHPHTALSLSNLAVLFCSQDRFSEAAKLMARARRGQRAHLSRVLPALSAREQELFLHSNYTLPFYSGLTLGLVQAEDEDMTSLSASWLINGKGVVQEALAQRGLQSRNLDDPALGPVFKEWQSAQTRLASLVMSAAEPGKEEQRRLELERLTVEEQRLSSRLGGNSNDTSQWIEISEIRDALSADSVLIDIARFGIMDFNAKGKEPRWKPAHYAAWMTLPNPNAKTVLIDLGDAAAIDKLIEDVRKRIAADASKAGAISKEGEEMAARAVMKNMSALAALIWKPLAQYVGDDAKQIILSPDGALWLAPWSALPVNDAGDEYLLERYNIRMVISGRDLVAKSDRRTTTAPVILANPSFDQKESQKKSAIQGIFKTLPPESENATRSFSAKSTLPKVQPLPNTGFEALAIQPYIETYTSKKAGLYKEQYALERVAKALRSPQIVTFATHGFFLPTQEIKQQDRSFATADNTRAVSLDTNGQLIENPLLRCGLLLSGCNNREASVADDDGILTGMEIVSIDLRGTELVVLSACETGIGDIKNGEGVAGLRQAFQLAGAESVVSTLWQVPDRDSALLMSKFFEELADGKTKADALRYAQLDRIEKRRQRYGAAHPFFWAAFTLTGK